MQRDNTADKKLSNEGDAGEVQGMPSFDERQGTWVLIATILASSMAFIDSTALNVALPALQHDLGASGSELLWLINAYLLMLASLILVGGAMGDVFGRKKVFAAGIILFMLASLCCGLAPHVEMLIAFRALQGIGGALMIPGSLAIISAVFPAHKRGRAIGTWSAAATIVTVVGPVLGGYLADLGMWRAVFLINLPLGLCALVVLQRYVPENRDPDADGRIDYPGAGLVSSGLAGLTYSCIAMPDLGLVDPSVLFGLTLGVTALTAFVRRQSRCPRPMLPLPLFRARTFTGANVLTLLLYGALSIGMLILSLTLVQAQDYTQVAAGLAFLPFALFMILLSRWAGSLADRIGTRLLLIIGPTVTAVGFILLAMIGATAGMDDYWHTFLPGLMVFGLGMALTVVPLTTAVMTSVDTARAGLASGVNNAVSRTAGVLAIAIVGALALHNFTTALESRLTALPLDEAEHQAVLATSGHLGNAAVPDAVREHMRPQAQEALRLAFIDSYQIVMLICAALSLLSAAIAFFLIEGKKA